MSNFDFEINRDRYVELNGTAKDDAGNVMSIANPVQIRFTMTNLHIPTQTFSKTSAVITEIAKITPAAGTYKIYIQAADTKLLTPGKYRYEIVFIDDPAATPSKPYTLNPTESDTALCLLQDILIEI